MINNVTDRWLKEKKKKKASFNNLWKEVKKEEKREKDPLVTFEKSKKGIMYWLNR